MSRANYCEFFRFDNRYCDVFKEDDHYLYAEAEPWNMPYYLTCKEFMPNGDGFIVSCYGPADVEYLNSLEYAPEDIAQKVIASEERYTLECMAPEYGYTRQYVVDIYTECIADGETPHEAFEYCACCMMERDL